MIKNLINLLIIYELLFYETILKIIYKINYLTKPLRKIIVRLNIYKKNIVLNLSILQQKILENRNF